jgi:membrane protein
MPAMNAIVSFVKQWYASSVDMIRSGDPLIMGAAIAYNSLFAVFPLFLAFFTVVTFFNSSSEVYLNLIDAVHTVLPEEIADFFTGILNESLEAVADGRLAIVVVSILIALWSGSRAVYTVQKSLRLVQGVDEDRGYVRARLTGIVVTIAAGASLIAAYMAMLIGGTAWDGVAEFFGFPSVGMAQLIIVVVASGWIFLLLWVIYHFGPPLPFERSALSAALVTVIIVVGTWAAQLVLPQFDVASLAVFGAVGLVLVWLYCIGIVVVAIPVAVVGFFAAMDDHAQR